MNRRLGVVLAVSLLAALMLSAGAFGGQRRSPGVSVTPSRSERIFSPRFAVPRGSVTSARLPREFVEREARRSLSEGIVGPLVQRYSSAFSETYAVATGGFDTKSFTYPVNYRSTAGAWTPIDNDLVSDGQGGLTNEANGWHVRLPLALAGRELQLVEGGGTVGFTPIGVGSSLASVQGTTATYRNAFSHVDLAYQAAPDEIRENIVLRTPQAASAYRFALALPSGWVPRLQGGQVLLFDSAGKRMPEVFDAPTVTDASSAIGGPLGPASDSLARTSRGWVLTISVGSAWLRAPGRKFPVTIDPNVSLSGPQTDCFIVSSLPTTSACSAGYVDLGASGGSTYRDLFEFGQLSLPSDAEILTSALAVYFGGGTAMSGATATPVTTSWDASATWDSTGYGPWNSPGGDTTTADGGDVETVPAAAGYVNWYLTTTVQHWVDESLPNDGILLQDDNGGTVRGAYSTNAGSGGQPPILNTNWTVRIGLPAAAPSVDVPLGAGSDVNINAANGDAEFHFPLFNINGTGLNFQLGLRFTPFAPLVGTLGQIAGAYMNFTPGPSLELFNSVDGSSGGAQVDPAIWGPDGQLRRWVLPTPSSPYYVSPGFDGQLAYLPFAPGSDVWLLQMNSTRESFVFDANPGPLYGLLMSDSSRNGETVTYNWTEVTNSGQYSGTVGELASITDSQGRTITPTYTTYTINGQPDEVVSKWTDSTGRTVSFGISPTSGLVTSITNAGGYTIDLSYNANNDIASVTDPDGHETTMSYNYYSQLTGITQVSNTSSGTGPTRTFAYAAPSSGSVCAKALTAQAAGTTSLVFSTVEQTTYTTPNGNNWIYCNDTHDRNTVIQDPAGNVTTNTYNYADGATGSILTTPTGAQVDKAQTQFLSDTDGVSTQEPTSGSQSSSGFQISSGSAQYPNEPSGLDTINTNAYEPTTTDDPQANQTQYSYDSNGNLLSVVDPLSSQNTINLTYSTGSVLGLLTSSTVPDGGKTTYGYDAVGNLTSVTPPAPMGTTTYQYGDGLSRVTSMTDADGNTSTYAYNALDQLTQATYAGNQTISYQYDPDQNLTTETSPGGIEANAFNNLGQLTQTNLPGGQALSYTYDADGNLKTFTDSGGIYTYAYNALDELTTLTQPDGTNITFAYNPEGERTQTNYPNGITLNVTYSPAGQPLTLTEVSGSTTTTLETYTYQAPSGETSSDLIASKTDQNGNVTTYTYDGLNRLLSAKTVTPSGATLSTYTYAYDGSGNMLSSVINGTTNSYVYNAASEQISANGSPETYDSDGNLLSGPGFAASYNTLDQPSAIDGNSYTFLGGGEDLEIQQGASGIVNSALGVSAIVGSSNTNYVTRDSSGTPLGETVGASDEYFITDPASGSVLDVTNGAGQTTRVNNFDPYGVLSTTGAGVDDIGWDGNTNPAGTIYHFGARQYWTGSDRWTQPDPDAQNLVSDPTQADPYVIDGDDPVNAQDASGTAYEGIEAGGFPNGPLGGAGGEPGGESRPLGPGSLPIPGLEGEAAGWTLDEIAQLAYGHEGGGDYGMGDRASLYQIQQTLRYGSRQSIGGDRVIFRRGLTRVIVNGWDIYKSTAFRVKP